MSADNLKVSTDSVNRLDVADVHKGNSPESESKNPSESLNSPLTSVKHLLADTDAAPPLQSEPQSQRPDASYEDSQKASEPQIRRKGKGKSKSGEKLNAAGSTHESPTFQQTLQDLRTLLMPFLKLLPFQSLQVYLKRFIAPLVRFIVRVVAKILHKWNFGLATNLAYDLHLLLWKVRILADSITYQLLRPFHLLGHYSGSSTYFSGRLDLEAHTECLVLVLFFSYADRIKIRCADHYLPLFIRLFTDLLSGRSSWTRCCL